MDLAGLGVRYARRSPWVLQQVDLALPAGALVEVTGRNGAGKSSLLRVLAGVLRPAAGVVLGRPDVVGWAPERFPAGQVMRTGDYLLAQARVRGLAAGAERSVQREAERLGLASLLEVPLAQLSKGSTQKVGLAQALLAPPGLLVLDEPWSGLDAAARDAVPEIARQVVDAGGSVAVADHQQQVAALAPDLRWHAEGGTVVVVPTRIIPGAVGRRLVVEVELDEEQAPEVLQELRRRGLSPRTMRVLALTRFRLRGALTGRVLLAPLVTLVALQLVGLAGGAEPAVVLMVTSACLALPVLAWTARQVLDAEPDDQVLLGALAVGGTVRGTVAGLLAAYVVAAPLAVACAGGSLLRVDGDAAPGRVVLAGTTLALVTALAAVGVGAFAARSVAGRGSAPVVVLVGAPVLIAVLGLAHSPLVTALVPRLDAAVRATNPPAGTLIKANDWFLPRAPAILIQILVWGVVVIGLRLLLAQRRS